MNVKTLKLILAFFFVKRVSFKYRKKDQKSKINNKFVFYINM